MEKHSDVNRVEIHRQICEELNKIYEKKNHDYGNSFAKVREKIPTAILVRLSDKVERLITLMQGAEQSVDNESIEDTLLDTANYAILELIERSIDNESRLKEMVW